MESTLASNLGDTLRIQATKSEPTFTKDAPKITRYSLAETPDEINAGMDYHLRIITRNDKHRVLKFLRRFFFRDEPLNRSIQLIPEGENSTCVELEEYCSSSSMENNLSLVAVSTNGAIIGVVLNGEMDEPSEGENEEEPEYIRECENHKFKKILRLLRHVDVNVNSNGQFRGQKVLEIKIISVDSNWRGKGVAKALVEKSVDIAREQGFHVVRADCSSLFSGKLCARVGFEPVFELNYADYVDEDGNAVFSPAFPHTNVTTYIKRL